MTKKIILLATSTMLAIVGYSTPVSFPLNSMFSPGGYTQTFRIDAANPVITDGSTGWVGSYLNVTPLGGTNPVVEMPPNDYLVTFPDARTPWRIRVPNTTNVQNAVTLTLGPLPSFWWSATPLNLTQNFTIGTDDFNSVVSPVIFAATNGFVTVSVTNGLAGIASVVAATNGLGSAAFQPAANFSFATNIANKNCTFVDAGLGSDTTGNGSQNFPWATLAKAISSTPNFWMIVGAAGEYAAASDFGKSHSFQFADGTIIDGLDFGNSTNVIEGNATMTLTIEGLATSVRGSGKDVGIALQGTGTPCHTTLDCSGSLTINYYSTGQILAAHASGPIVFLYPNFVTSCVMNMVSDTSIAFQYPFSGSVNAFSNSSTFIAPTGIITATNTGFGAPIYFTFGNIVGATNITSAPSTGTNIFLRGFPTLDALPIGATNFHGAFRY
jgi:hypothetical protein